MYYKLEDDHGNLLLEILDFIDIQATQDYKGLALVKLTDVNFDVLDDTKICFEGKRIRPSNTNSGFKITQYVERVFIKDSDGDEVEFSSVYNDGGTGFATEIPFVDYLITSASGKYANFNIARITFDNDGTVFSSKKKTRKITFH